MTSVEKAEMNSIEHWIGEIPEDWKLSKLKFAYSVIPSNVDKKHKEGEMSIALCNYVDVYKNDYISHSLDYMQATASDIQIEKLSLKKGDVIATKDSEDPSDIGIPALVIEDLDNVVCGYHLTVLRTRDVNHNGRFLFWYLRANFVSQHFQTMARGITRFALGTSSFKDLRIPVIPIEIQIKIANYLDHKTAQIDDLIAKKERLIELLGEERVAAINKAVTKGLDPNVPMKDSGIEWLGEIPEHWERLRIKNIVSTKVCDGPHETPEWQSSGVPFISAEAIRGNTIDFDFKRGYISEQQHAEYSRKAKAQYGDILFCKSGSTTGKSALVTTRMEFGIWSPLAIIRSNPQMVNFRFLFMSLQSNSFIKQVQTGWTFGTQPNIGMGVIENLWVALPPISEQIEVVNFLNEQNKRIDALIETGKNEVTLLQEYKSALISEVVTGKIDVRKLKLE